MKVIIVSKTRMSKHYCIGGILIDGQFVRLLNSEGYNQPLNTSFEIGDYYDITYRERNTIIPPHTEDILVDSTRLISHLTLKELTSLIKELDLKYRLNVPIIQNSSPMALFDNSLHQDKTNGNLYISKEGRIPSFSTQFWISDKPLIKIIFRDEIRDFVKSENITEYSPIKRSYKGHPYMFYYSQKEGIEKRYCIFFSESLCQERNINEDTKLQKGFFEGMEIIQDKSQIDNPKYTLISKDEKYTIRYRYGTDINTIPFVGLQEPIDEIPAGTLLRVSLARWWSPNENTEERCYLQLSGYYDLND